MLTLTVIIICLAAIAAADALAGYRPVPPGWHAPRPWLYEAWCLHDGVKRDARGRELYRVTLNGKPMMGEGAWNAIGYVNGVATYGGGLQFLLSTWLRAGGAARSLADIAAASPREQLYRAWVIWKSHHGSWSEWGDMRVACGLR